MAEKILVLGCDGYIGHALVMRLLNKGYDVVGVDDFRRRRSVKEMESFSATKIKKMVEKEEVFKSIGNFEFYSFSLEEENEYDRLKEIISEDFFAIVNLAQQPSAPYSQISLGHAHSTVIGNLMSTINILYAMRETSSKAQLVQIGTMGEYDPAVNVDIPEGIFDFDYKGRTAKTSIFPRRPGSIYHASKVASTYYIDCACRWWDIKATDIMQGVVYGGWTPEIEKHGLYSRLDSDEAFGTVVHRFVIQALIGSPLTVFGKGLHSRGFLAINDCVQCLMLAIENIPADGEYRTWNQLDVVHSMNDIVGKVRTVAKEFGMKISKDFIKSPRAEAVDDHYYNPVVNKLKKLGFKPTRNLIDEIRFLFNVLIDNVDELMALEHVVIPKIMWR